MNSKNPVYLALAEKDLIVKTMEATKIKQETLAMLQMVKYKALIKAGFTECQALKIVIGNS